jgi:hypothetical protein
MKPITALILSTIITSTSLGHVYLLAPTGNDVLEVDSTYEISWEITIAHTTQNWDLLYSTESQLGPWHDIAINLPVGDNSSGSIHAFDWVIPNMPSETVWVKIVQDNVDGDYDDTNDLPFVIVAPNDCPSDITGDDTVGVSDLLMVIDVWGETDSTADVNADGIVNVSDLLMVVGNWGPC